MVRDAGSELMVSKPSRVRRVLSVSGLVVLMLAVGVAVGWAAASVFAPHPVLNESTYTLVTVEPGSVKSSMTVNAYAVWSRTPITSNSAAGTVTKVGVTTADPVTAGDTLYWVDLKPVVVLPGVVPAFRTMQEGSKGEDVAQLQAFLIAHKYLQASPKGTWDETTTAGVRAWQKKAGMDVDGVVDTGEVVFVPSLPARLVFDDGVIRVSGRLSGGEDAIFQLASKPEFTLPVSDSQAALMPVGSRVEVRNPDGGTWQAWIIDQSQSDPGLVTLALSGSADSNTSVCGNECGMVPGDADGVLLRSQVITVEETNGLVVPSAAVMTTPDGKTALIDANGTVLPVTVLAGAKGMTVIEGVPAGTLVRAPAEVSQ